MVILSQNRELFAFCRYELFGMNNFEKFLRHKVSHFPQNHAQRFLSFLMQKITKNVYLKIEKAKTIGTKVSLFKILHFEKEENTSTVLGFICFKRGLHYYCCYNYYYCLHDCGKNMLKPFCFYYMSLFWYGSVSEFLFGMCCLKSLPFTQNIHRLDHIKMQISHIDKYSILFDPLFLAFVSSKLKDSKVVR